MLFLIIYTPNICWLPIYITTTPHHHSHSNHVLETNKTDQNQQVSRGQAVPGRLKQKLWASQRHWNQDLGIGECPAPSCHMLIVYPIGSMYAIYGDIYHQYTPNVSIYTIHGSYGYDSGSDIVQLPGTVSMFRLFEKVKKKLGGPPSHSQWPRCSCTGCMSSGKLDETIFWGMEHVPLYRRIQQPTAHSLPYQFVTEFSKIWRWKNAARNAGFWGSPVVTLGLFHLIRCGPGAIYNKFELVPGGRQVHFRDWAVPGDVAAEIWLRRNPMECQEGCQCQTRNDPRSRSK